MIERHQENRVRRAGGYACLTLCVLLAIFAALTGEKDRRASDEYTPLGRKTEIAAIRVSTIGTIDPNLADLYELTELPGVGETIAGYVLDEREANGPFFYPEDLMQVKGIGPKKLEGFWNLLDLDAEDAP